MIKLSKAQQLLQILDVKAYTERHLAVTKHFLRDEAQRKRTEDFLDNLGTEWTDIDVKITEQFVRQNYTPRNRKTGQTRLGALLDNIAKTQLADACGIKRSRLNQLCNSSEGELSAEEFWKIAKELKWNAGTCLNKLYRIPKTEKDG